MSFQWMVAKAMIIRTLFFVKVICHPLKLSPISRETAVVLWFNQTENLYLKVSISKDN